MTRPRSALRRQLLWGAGAALLAGAGARALRPARLLGAKVTAITAGNPPTASVVLTYGPGMLPSSVVVDVLDRAGHGGSATIAGTQLFLELPLIGMLGSDHHVTTTATYRLLGMPLTFVDEFA